MAKADIVCHPPDDPKDKPSFCQQFFSWRMVIFILLQFSIVTMGLPRTTFNMAFVCSATRRQQALGMINNMSVHSDVAPHGGHSDMVDSQLWSNFSNIGEVDKKVMSDLNWEPKIRGLVLSAPVFLAGIGSTVSDLLRQRLGNNLVFTTAFILAGSIMLVSPILARTNPYLVIATQIVLGLTLESNTPVVGDVLPHWTPVSQRLTGYFIVFAGYSTGPILSSMVNGLLCSIPTDNGWPFIFYISGFAYFLYAAAWNLIGGDWPETHRFISSSEKAFIVSTRPKLSPNGTKKKPEKPPYVSMLSSPAVLAYLFLSSCFLWGMYVVIVTLPVYFNSVLGFSAQQTGVVFSCVVCVRLFGGLLWTLTGNALVSRNILSYPSTRKMCLCLGFGGAGCAHLVVAFFQQSSKWTAVVFTMLGQGLQSVATSHLSSVSQDLAPRYAGTLMSIAFTVSLMVALTAPLAVTALTPVGLYEEWRVVWLLLSTAYIGGSVVFLMFGEAKIQNWAAQATPENQSDLACTKLNGGTIPGEDVNNSLLGNRSEKTGASDDDKVGIC